MAVALEHAVDLFEELGESRVRKNLEPVVAGRLAVLEPRGRADRPVLLQRFVGRVGDQQIHRFGWEISKPPDGVLREQLERNRGHNTSG
jgi:hypothetical protein